MKILMLHDVRPFDQSFFPDRYSQHSFLSDTAFIRGLDSIEKRIITPAQILSYAHATEPDKYALTFDDGLKDHLWVAELLAERKVKAIFFIPFGILETKSFISSHLIQFLNASGKRDVIAKYIYDYLLSMGVSRDLVDSYKISRWKNNLWTMDEVFITRSLREVLDNNFRHKLIDVLVEKFLKVDLDHLHESFYLNFQDVLQISKMGHTIGSHGYLSHDLRYEDTSSVKNELSKSKCYLDEYPGSDRIISYANGGFNQSIKSIANSVGYNFGFGTQHEDCKKSSDPLHVPRIDGTKIKVFV